MEQSGRRTCVDAVTGGGSSYESALTDETTESIDFFASPKSIDGLGIVVQRVIDAGEARFHQRLSTMNCAALSASRIGMP